MNLTHILKTSMMICLMGIFGISFSNLNAQNQNADPCQLAQQNLRYYFLEYTPETFLNLKYLEDMYYSCEKPNLRSSIIYYYLKSVHLLNVDENYIDKPSDMFFYFYRGFQTYAARIGEIAYMDPEFATAFYQRKESLEQLAGKAEVYGNQPVISNNNAGRNSDYNTGYNNSGNNYDNSNMRQPQGGNIQRGGGSLPLPVEGILDFPNMPLPPPVASSQEVFPNALFRQSRALSDIDKELTIALNANGYYSKHYFSVPDGFAVVTQLEHTYPDGEPLNTYDRWEASVKLKNLFSLRDYFISLVFAKPGFYRTIAFVVAPAGVSRNPLLAGGKMNESYWRTTEGEKLPVGVGALPFTNRYNVTAYIYEFEVPDTGEEARIIAPVEQGGSALQARVHLQKAGIWDLLVN